MPFDGNGIYNPISPPDFPAEPGTLIRASQYNNQITDMASALTNCLTRDGQGRPTGDINFNTFKITNLGPSENPGDAVRQDQVVPLVAEGFASTGLTMNNQVSLKGKRTDAAIYNLIYVGSDNHIYFGTTGGGWYMRYNSTLGRVEFNVHVRGSGNADFVGVVRSSNNVSAFVPGL